MKDLKDIAVWRALWSFFRPFYPFPKVFTQQKPNHADKPSRTNVLVQVLHTRNVGCIAENEQEYERKLVDLKG